MKTNKLLGGLALTAMLAAGLSSCSNDMEDYQVSSSVKSLVNQAPKINAYSGDQTWGQFGATRSNTRSSGTSADGIISWTEITTTALDLEAEAKYIDERLPEGQQTIDGVDYDFIYYTDKAIEVEMFPVYMQTNKTQSYGIFYYDAAGTYHEELIWEGFTQWNRSSQEWSQEQGKNLDKLTGFKINIPANTTFGFFIAVCDYKPTDWSSEWNVQDKAYTSSHLNKEGYNSDSSYKTRVRAITWYGNGKTYLGFEDWTDFDYQDLVFTMDREVSTVDASTFVPGENPNPGTTPEPEENCDKCGHESHLPGNCPTCDNNENGGCYTPSTPEQPTTPPVVGGDNHTDEVEVNLGIDTKGETSGGKYNESHLSIHVRSAVDVDMFIPMPLELICPADDLEIVKKHLAGEMEHGGEFENPQYDESGKVIMQGGLLSKMTYRIADKWDVSIYVEYVAGGSTSHYGETFAEDGIHIWTEGLEGNTALFEYLQETYGDGITFEIWNYFSDESTLSELKSHLDQSTIRFIGNVLPKYFINAFGQENYEADKDCEVNMVEDQASNYDYKGTGTHLNGSSYNEIYERNTDGTTQNPPYPPVY